MKLLSYSAILSFFITAVIYYQSNSIFSDYIIKDRAIYESNICVQVNGGFKTIMENNERYSKKISGSPVVQGLLTQEMRGFPLISIRDSLSALDSELNKVFFSRNSIESVIIAGKNNLACIYSWGNSSTFAGTDFIFNRFYTALQNLTTPENEGRPVYIGTDIAGNFSKSESEESLYEYMKGKVAYVRSVRDSNSETVGLILYILDPGFISELYPEIQNDTALYLLTGSNQVIWSYNFRNISDRGATGCPIPEKDGYITVSVNNVRTLITSYTLEPYDLKVLTHIPVSSILSKFSGINRYIPVLLLVFFCFMLPASYFISLMIIKPLHKLSESLSTRREKLDSKVEAPTGGSLSRFSLRTKVVCYFIITTIIPNLIFISILLFTYYYRYTDNIRQMASSNMAQAKKGMENKLTGYDSFIKEICYSDAVQDTLNDSADGGRLEAGVQESNLLVEKYVSDIKFSKQDFLSMRLYDLDGNIVYSSVFFDDFPVESISGNFSDIMGKSEGRLVYLGTSKSESINPALIFARSIKSISFSNFSKNIGYMVIYSSHDMFNDITSQSRLGDTGYFFILDGGGSIINHYNKNLTQRILDLEDNRAKLGAAMEGSFFTSLDGKRYMVVYNTAGEFNLKVVGILPYYEIQERVYPLLSYGALTLLLYLLIIFFVSTAISFGLTRPVKKLRAMMDKAAYDTGARMSNRSRDEIGILAGSFNNMIEQLEKLIKENYQSRLRESELLFLEKEAQLNALQQQINPHFLYNTLEAINWMAYKKGALDICDVVTALGNFFRGSVAKSKELITFDQEIEHLENYIYIQKIRYQGRFDVEWNIADEIRTYKTIRLILQPIVENAIVHGIDSYEEGGIIKITGYKREERIYIEISDNGVGMSEEKLQELKDRLFKSNTINPGIGIFNVYRRLSLYFEDSLTFDIDSRKDSGTVVCFSIPAILFS